jgi:hypothetical protein
MPIGNTDDLGRTSRNQSWRSQQIKVKIKVKVGIAPQVFIIDENIQHPIMNK